MGDANPREAALGLEAPPPAIPASAAAPPPAIPASRNLLAGASQEALSATERELLRQLRAEFCDRCGSTVRLGAWPFAKGRRRPLLALAGVASIAAVVLASRALGALAGLEVFAGAAALALAASTVVTRHRCVACLAAPEPSLLDAPDQLDRARRRRSLGLAAAGCALLAVAPAVRYLPEPVLRYVGASARWSVTFPRTYQVRTAATADVVTPYGKGKASIQTASGGLGSVAVFTLFEMDLRDAKVGGKVGTTRVLHAVLKSLDFVPGQEEAITGGGLRGREAAVLGKGDGEPVFGRARAYWVGHAFVMALYAGKEANAPEGRAFLETLTRGP